MNDTRWIESACGNGLPPFVTGGFLYGTNHQRVHRIALDGSIATLDGFVSTKTMQVIQHKEPIPPVDLIFPPETQETIVTIGSFDYREGNILSYRNAAFNRQYIIDAFDNQPAMVIRSDIHPLLSIRLDDLTGRRSAVIAPFRCAQ